MKSHLSQLPEFLTPTERGLFMDLNTHSEGLYIRAWQLSNKYSDSNLKEENGATTLKNREKRKKKLQSFKLPKIVDAHATDTIMINNKVQVSWRGELQRKELEQMAAICSHNETLLKKPPERLVFHCDVIPSVASNHQFLIDITQGCQEVTWVEFCPKLEDTLGLGPIWCFVTFHSWPDPVRAITLPVVLLRTGRPRVHDSMAARASSQLTLEGGEHQTIV